ncbi:MAG: phosphoribosylformylglycinamidine synthase I [Tepidisphaeraceae bacterium]
MKPRTLILRTAGTNCDGETQHAFELAGASVDRLHLNHLLRDPSILSNYQMLAFAGGFSYGDDIAAGKILANQITHHLREPLRAFIDAGKPIIGICNGFQVLVKTDLLPGSKTAPAAQTATLAHNDCGRFVCEWVRVKAVSKKCVWTKDLGEIDLPIAHGEGKFVPATDAIRRQLQDNDQIALVYADENPNGSTDAIAGVCDESGLVFGLMPHPERHVSVLQHPAWTRQGDPTREGAGLKVFRNAVKHVEQAVGAGV